MLWRRCAECVDDFICFGPLYFACDYADKIPCHFVKKNIPLREVGYLKNVTRGWLTADISHYIVLNKIGRVLNHCQFTLS